MHAKWGRVLQATGIAFILVATLAVFVPLAIYAGNQAEFSVSVTTIISSYAAKAAGLVLVLGVIAATLSTRGFRRYLAVLAALAVLTWLQANLLVWEYGVFDGRDIDWLAGAWRGVFDLAIWIAVLGIAISRFERFGRPLQLAAVATFVIQFVSLALFLVAAPQSSGPSSAEMESADTGALYAFSEEANIVHIVMDGFQSDIFTAIVNDSSASRDYKSALSGFTHYTDHLGAYPYTQLTMPAMLSGRLFYNDVPMDAFVADVMAGRTILSAAKENGYAVDVAAPVALRNVYALAPVTNAYGIAATRHASERDYVAVDAAKLLDLTLFRAVPHFSKPLVYRDELWVFQSQLHGNAWLQMQYFADLKFLGDLAGSLNATSGQPRYKLIHAMLSHRPIVGNEDCGYDGRKSADRAAVTIHARCGLDAVVDVLDRMKDAGVYDNSLIVLMADHGAWVPLDNFAGNDVVDAMTAAMASPVLLIKPPGAQGPLQTSAVPSSLIDLPATIADITDIDAEFPGESILRLDAGMQRERRHLTYAFGVNPDAEGYLFPMREYMIQGNSKNASAWSAGQRYLPGGTIDGNSEH